MFLVQLDPENKDANGNARFIGAIGRIVEVQTEEAGGIGYRFQSLVSSHKNSRKVWPSVNACIPKWTRTIGFLGLYDKAELDAALSVQR